MPKKIVAIIGMGQVGRALYALLQLYGYEVRGYDTDRFRSTVETLDEAVKDADWVFVAVLPIASVYGVIIECAQTMKRGAVLFDCTSIEPLVTDNPGDVPTHCHWVDTSVLDASGVTLYHFHLHFGPKIPLENMLNGRVVTLSKLNGHREDNDETIHELICILKDCNADVIRLEPGQHNDITLTSQVAHAVTAMVEAGRIYSSSMISDANLKTLKSGLKIGGPPRQLFTRLVIRCSRFADVLAEILCHHPLSINLIEGQIETLNRLIKAITKQDISGIARAISSVTDPFSQEEVTSWGSSTDVILKALADWDGAATMYTFPKEADRCGLLADVLAAYDKYGVNKTSTLAQVTGNEIIFLIGAQRVDDTTIAAIVAEIVSTFGATVRS